MEKIVIENEINRCNMIKGGKLKIKSIDNYCKQLINLAYGMKFTEIQGYKKCDEILDYATKNMTISIAKMAINAIKFILDEKIDKIVFDKYSVFLERINTIIKNKKEDSKFSLKELLKYPSISDFTRTKAFLLGKMEKCKNDPNEFKKIFQKYLCVSLYVEQAPPRNDYCIAKIRNYDEETDNFIKDGIFWDNQYKTNTQLD